MRTALTASRARAIDWPSAGLSALAALLIVAAAYGPPLAQGNVLIPADMLDAFAPWSHSSTIDRPSNPLLGDQIQQMYPWRVFVHEELAAGRFPLLNPYAGAGTPLFANGQSAILFPLNLAVLWLAPELAATATQIVKPPLAAAGMALFLSALSVSRVGAVLGGLAWAFSGPMVAWLGWPHTNALLMVPYLFWATVRWLQTASLRWWGVNAVLVGVQLLGGHPETTAHTLVLEGIFAFVARLEVELGQRTSDQSLSHRLVDHGRLLVGWIPSVGAGVAVAGIQVLPTLAAVAESVTAAERGSKGLASIVLEAPTVLTWIVPNFFGTPLAQTFGPLNFLNYNETMGYVGLGTVVLALTSVFRPRAQGWLALVAITIIAAGLAYGIPVLTELRRAPGLNYAANTRFVYFVAFGIAALAAIGLDACLRAPRERIATLLSVALLGAVCASCVGLAVIYTVLAPTPEGAAPLTQDAAATWRRGELLKTALLALLWCAAVAAVLAPRLWTRFLISRASEHFGFLALAMSSGVLVVVVAGVDLFVFGARYNPATSPSLLTRVPPAIEFVKREDPNGRVAALAETLLPNTAMLFRLHDFRVYEPVADHRLLRYFERLDDELEGDIRSRFYLFLWKPRAPLLGVAGVRWLLAPESDDRTATASALAEAGLVWRFSAEGTAVWEHPGARPRAYVAERLAVVNDPNAALDWLGEYGHEATATVVVSDGSRVTACPSTGTACRDPMAAGTGAVRRATFLPGQARIDVSMTRDGLLVVNDLLYAGWIATVNGERVDILRANYLFMGVPVPAGDHQVVLEYRPPPVAAGAMMSFASLALMSLLFAVRGLRVRVPLLSHRAARERQAIG